MSKMLLTNLVESIYNTYIIFGGIDSQRNRQNVEIKILDNLFTYCTQYNK